MFKLDKPVASLKEIILKSVWYGFVAGMISGMVKIGWENLLPPRTIARNLTNPPQTMMEQFGVPHSLTHAYVYYSHDQKVFWFTLICTSHFLYSLPWPMYLFHNTGQRLGCGKVLLTVSSYGSLGTSF